MIKASEISGILKNYKGAKVDRGGLFIRKNEVSDWKFWDDVEDEVEAKEALREHFELSHDGLGE